MVGYRQKMGSAYSLEYMNPNGGGKNVRMMSKSIREHEIADVTKKARIYTILSEIFTLCLCF
jgi:hypothetical protein